MIIYLILSTAKTWESKRLVLKLNLASAKSRVIAMHAEWMRLGSSHVKVILQDLQ